MAMIGHLMHGSGLERMAAHLEQLLLLLHSYSMQR
jgi:hypothetical protein